MEEHIMTNMKNKNMGAKKGEIVIYKAKSGVVRLDVRLENETTWLTQSQIAILFGTQRPAITKHLSNIFKSKELDKKSVCSILEHTAKDGKTYSTMFYNLDAIISIGYRVNSNRATQFRIWATKVLKEYLIKRYALNQKRLVEENTKRLNELRYAIGLIKSKSRFPELTGRVPEIMDLLDDYAGALTLLDSYDKKTISLSRTGKPHFALTYEVMIEIVDKMRRRLAEKKEASRLFGQGAENKLKGIAGALYQTFGGRELYPSIEEKAAHILYLVIKDHPFADGNKRIASIFFVYFLEQNNFLRKRNGERKIGDTTIVALSLLVATSEPKEKDIMIKIITNLL